MKSSIDSSSGSEQPLGPALEGAAGDERLVERAVLEDFAQPLVTRWRTSGDGIVETFARRHVLERASGPRGPRLSWSWTARRHGAALALRANLWWPRPFSVLRLEGSFEGDTSVQVLWSVGDVGGRRSAIPRPINLHAGRGQRWTLDLAQLERGEEGFRGPLRSLRLQLLSPPIGRAFRWSFDRILVEAWSGDEVGMSAPAMARAGERLAIELEREVRGELVLLSPAGVLLGRWSSGEDIRLPEHLPAGDGRLELWSEGRLLASSPLAIRSAPPRGPARASIVSHRGRPALAIDGRPQSGIAYTAYHPREELADRFARIGTRVLSFPTTCDFHVFDLAPPAAVEPDRFDFSFVDHVATRLLDRVPNGWLLPRVFVSSPPWWDEENPEAMGLAREGDRSSPLEMVHDDGELAKECASWASRRWRAWAEGALRRYVEHLRAAPYADRVIGICLASGGTEEWFHWHDERRPERWGDLGPAAEAAFRAWLRKRYRGDVAALRRAWRGEAVDFDSAVIPPIEALQQTEPDRIWRDPERERPAIDFLRFHQEQVAAAISSLAKVAREASEGQWVIGAFYGYVLVHTGHHRHLNGGHFALERLLTSKSVDFLCAPTGYGARALGEGFPYFMAPIESLQRHGLLWFDENDIRTHLLEVSEDRSGSLYRQGYGLTDDLEEGRSIQLRELGYCLQRGTPWWWFDIYARGQYDDDPLEEVLARLRSIHDALFESDRRSVAEVAVFIDERAPLYEDGRGRAFLESVAAARESIARLGAPVDEYLLDDLPGLRPYRLYVFLNAVAPSRRVRRAVQQLQRREDATLLWLGPCGLIRSERIAAGGPERLTRLPLRVAAQGREDQIVEISPCGRLRRSGGLRWGHGGIPAPRVEISATAEGEVWGRTPDGQPAVIATSPRPGRCRSIHALAPAPPVELWRDIAELAGVHLYLETGDPLSVSARAITIHGRRDARVPLRLPRPAPLFEPWTRLSVSPRSKQHTIRIERGETRLFFLGTEGEWRRLERLAEGRARSLGQPGSFS